MGGLVDPQALDVGPVEDARPLTRHLLRVQQGGEGDVLRLGGGLDSLDQLRKWKTQPGNDHRPGLHAAHAIDPLLKIKPTSESVDVHDLGLVDLALDGYRPGFWPKALCV